MPTCSSRVIALAAGALMAIATAAPHARQSTQPQQPIFRARADLVQVDVTVVDRDGIPVHGLTRADFVLVDRRTRQSISTFSEESGPLTLGPPPPPTLDVPSVRLDVAQNQIAAPDRLVVMVVDDLHIYQGRTDRTKDIARDVVRQLGPPAAMAVLFTSGDHSTPVTRDPRELLAAIDAMKGARGFRRPAQAIDKQGPGHIDPGASIDSVLSQLSTAQHADLRDFYDNMTQYKALQDAARMLGPEDARRKAFVLVSEGIGKDLTGLFEGSGYDTSPCEAMCPTCPCYHDVALRQTMASLWRAHVVTYAIDPRGRVDAGNLAREAFPDLTSGLGDDPATGGLARYNPIRQAQSGLSIMAEASGGFAVTNTDDYAGGLSRIVESIDHYYLLGFYPSDPSGTKARPLDVTVPMHPDWRVHFRKSYDPVKPAPPANRDALANMAVGVLPRTDLPLRCFAAALPATDKPARVAVTLEATLPVAGVRRPDGRLEDQIRYAVYAANLKSGKIAASVGNTAKVTADRNTSVTGDTFAIQVPIQLTLPPGRYQLRASAESATLKLGGSVYLSFEVPDYTKDAVALSDLVIGYGQGPRLPVASRGGSSPAARAGTLLPFEPTLDRRFTREDGLRVYAEFVHPARGAEPRIAIDVLDASGRTALSVAPNAGAALAGRIDAHLSLATLPLATYQLRITITAGTSKAERSIVFVVR